VTEASSSPRTVWLVGSKLIAERLHHGPEALQGGKGIGVTGGQLLRSLKPSCDFTFNRDDFRDGTAD
jgi:hypothetical protein